MKYSELQSKLKEIVDFDLNEEQVNDIMIACRQYEGELQQKKSQIEAMAAIICTKWQNTTAADNKIANWAVNQSLAIINEVDKRFK